MVAPAIVILPVHENSPALSVVVIPSSKAAEDVTSLKVEPGSYVSDIALFRHIACIFLILSAEPGS